MNQIYTITAFQRIKPSKINGISDIGDHRCMGFYHNFYEAENSVLENYKNIYDGMYNYVIIEKMKPGIRTKDEKRSLYEWTGSYYEKISIVPEIKYLSNFSMG